MADKLYATLAVCSFWKHQDQGCRQRQVSEEDQLVAIQLPTAEDGD